MGQVSNYQALLSGYSWYRADVVGRPVILTYSFETVAPAYFSSRDPQGAATIQTLSESEKVVVREALAQWASVSGVTFLETTRHQGDLTFAFYDFARLATPSDASGLGYYPSSFAYAQNSIDHAYSGEALVGGDILFSASYRQSSVFMQDLEHLALHEIGHALGLKHPFDVTMGHEETLTYSADNGHNTVMSYTAPRTDHLGPLDIAAAQHLYGGPNADGSHLASFHWDPAAEQLTQVGTPGADLLRGTGASDVIHSAGGKDVIYTAQGNDYIVLIGQAAEVHGGTGLDTVVTGISVLDSSAVWNSGSFSGVRLSDGSTQSFLDVERLVFGDLTLAFDTGAGEHAGQIYRMYQAAFDRMPDTPGLTFNLANYDDRGFTLKEMANFFVVSPEFASLYGANSNDTTFVNAMYANVLERGPDAGGLAYYLTRLGDGVWDRADVLAGFAESPENIALVASSTQNGITLQSDLLLV